MILLYYQANDKLGTGKFKPMWNGPYIVKHVLKKGAYELVDYKGNALAQPHNGFYLKKYYVRFPYNYFCRLVCEFIDVHFHFLVQLFSFRHVSSTYLVFHSICRCYQTIMLVFLMVLLVAHKTYLLHLGHSSPLMAS